MGVAPSTLCAYELWRRFPTLERALEIEALTGQGVKALDLINPKKKTGNRIDQGGRILRPRGTVSLFPDRDPWRGVGKEGDRWRP